MTETKKHSSEYDTLEASSKSMLFGLRRERLLLQVTQVLCETLAQEDLTQAQLARKLGKSESFVSQVLAGGRNLTLRTLADLATALDREIAISLRRRSHCRSILHFPVLWRPRQDFAIKESETVGVGEGAA